MRIARGFIIVVALTAGTTRANVVGPDTQNFATTSDGLDFVTVHSAETLAPGYFNLGLFTNYAINSLPALTDDAGQKRTRVNDTILSTEVNLGLGLSERWSAGVSFPAVLRQTVDDDRPYGQFGRTGITETRVNLKTRLFKRSKWGLAAIGSANFNRIRNNPYTGVGGGPVYNLELALERKFWFGFTGAVNGGYRFRNPGDQKPGSLISPVKDQVIASAAVSYLIPTVDVLAISEIFGSRPAGGGKSEGRQASSLEWLVGGKYDATQNLSLHSGVGTELIHGASSPDWRFYAGATWTAGPAWKNAAQRPLVDKIDPVSPAASPAPALTMRTVSIEFDFGSAGISAGKADETFGALLAELTKLGSWSRMVVSGHTDSIGSLEKNQLLSEQRAANVKTYLVVHYGLNGSKIETRGFGETMPIAENSSLQGRQRNRRVEFEVYK